jgi:cytochrome P450
MPPAFGRARLEGMIPIVARHAEAAARTLEPGRRVRAHDVFMELALAIVVETMFGASLRADRAELAAALGAIGRYVGRYSMVPFRIPEGLPTPDARSFRAGVATLDRLVSDLLASRNDRPPTEDLLGALTSARDPDTGAGLTDRELRDEALGIVYAGHETTANALTWAAALLDSNPTIADAVHREVAAVLGDRTPTAADLPRLELTTAVVRETLRLYPPAWMFARTAMSDDTVGGLTIRAGTVVLVSPWVTHRLPGLWSNPDEFDPGRFLRDPGLAAGGRPLRYYPFGLGGHQCIGNHLAVMEATVILAILARRVRLRVDRPDRVRPRPGATLGVAGGLPVTCSAPS